MAESHRRKLGIFGPSRKLNVDISPQAIHMVDDIVVTFIIIAEEGRERDHVMAHSAAEAAVVAASG
jgi:hypothetical protein